VTAALEEVAVTERTLGAAVLVTNELASNAMSHAGDTDVVVRLSCTPEDLRIEVHDHDPAMTDPDQAGDLPPWSGLQIVQAHCREWGVERDEGGKRVWALLPLP
jgi:anti-sigma regulatory factor (Ser/Thr protein kinase)